MGGVPVKHHSKSKVGRRRAHLALKPKALRRCESCGGPTFSHQTCRQCGTYAGRKKSPAVGLNTPVASKSK